MIAIDLTEWDAREPTHDVRLAARRLDDEQCRNLARQLSRLGMLTVTELAAGLSIETSSFVGVISVGSLRISIRPKIAPDLLLRLFRFAYNLRDLDLFGPARYGDIDLLFRDLIIHQLLAEGKELLARGLQRKYVRMDEGLPTPRGRIDIGAIARNGGITTAVLPCTHHPRMVDCLFNQVLLAGLKLAASITDDLHLRSDVRCLIRMIQDDVSAVELNSDLFDRLARQMNRLTVAYEPAVSLIQMLYECGGVDLPEGNRMKLPGFLFDMNRFFQALISRFLGEHLVDLTVEDEHRLQGMMSYVPSFNPRRRRAPCPRPDFAVFSGQTLRALLDAKYRDLWNKDLPREMLYQLCIYAMSMERERRAVILYPTESTNAREAVVEVHEPIHGGSSARVVLRPVHLARLDLVLGHNVTPQERSAYAKWLALGA